MTKFQKWSIFWVFYNIALIAILIITISQEMIVWSIILTFVFMVTIQFMFMNILLEHLIRKTK